MGKSARATPGKNQADGAAGEDPGEAGGITVDFWTNVEMPRVPTGRQPTGSPRGDLVAAL
jgi:hypothetical protein